MSEQNSGVGLLKDGSTIWLRDLTTDAVQHLLSSHSKLVVLIPVGSTEPHGPHLPLDTDVTISEGACVEGARQLISHGYFAIIAPAISYGVTEYAAGFAGAISVPATVLTAYLRAVVESFLATGFAHVCLVNNHLEPAHDAAVRESIVGLAGRASVACPLTRRWGKQLTAEFKSGACHAGQYETSLVLAAKPTAAIVERSKNLEALGVSLSEGIRQGKKTFRELGLQHAYTGDPAAASVDEGRSTFVTLGNMVATEVIESLQTAVGPLQTTHNARS